MHLSLRLDEQIVRVLCRTVVEMSSTVIFWVQPVRWSCFPDHHCYEQFAEPALPYCRPVNQVDDFAWGNWNDVLANDAVAHKVGDGVPKQYTLEIVGKYIHFRQQKPPCSNLSSAILRWRMVWKSDGSRVHPLQKDVEDPWIRFWKVDLVMQALLEQAVASGLEERRNFANKPFVDMEGGFLRSHRDCDCAIILVSDHSLVDLISTK